MKSIFHLYAAAVMLSTTSAAWGAGIPSGISVSPTPGSTVEQIHVIEVSGNWLEPNPKATAIMIDGISAPVTVTRPDDMFDNLTFTLSTPVTANGTHTVTFPDGTFLIGWENDPNTQFQYDLKVENDIPGGDNPGGEEIFDNVPEGYTVQPAAGEEVSVLTSISVTSESHLFLLPKLHPGITINGKAVNTVHAVTGQTENTITWTLAEAVSAPGLYNIGIPAGAFFDLQEEDNEPFLFTVRVTGGDIPAPDYYPADQVTSDPLSGSTVTELSKFAIMYPKLTSVFIGPADGDVRLTVNGAEAEAVINMAPDEDTFNEAHVMWVETEQPLKNAGTYTFHFPAKCFIVSKYPVNKYSAPFTLTFTVDPDYVALDEVNADADINGTAAYFTPAGVKVARPTAPGIYLQRTAQGTRKIVIR